MNGLFKCKGSFFRISKGKKTWREEKKLFGESIGHRLVEVGAWCAYTRYHDGNESSVQTTPVQHDPTRKMLRADIARRRLMTSTFYQITWYNFTEVFFPFGACPVTKDNVQIVFFKQRQTTTTTININITTPTPP